MDKIIVAAQQIASINTFLDFLINKQNLRNDAALSRMLKVAPPVISKLRSGRTAAGPSFVLRVHEITGMLVEEIRQYIPNIADRMIQE